MMLSLTSNAVQKNWRMPCEFPSCPQCIVESPLLTYADNLTVGSLFCSNDLYSSIVANFALTSDGQEIWVKCKGSSAIKPWALARITYEDDRFVHTSFGNFFSEDGVDKQFCLAQGLPWNGDESVDDYC